MMATPPSKVEPNGISLTQEEMAERFSLVQKIKKLNKEKLSLLGVVMCSPEYMELDPDNVQPSKENHGSIELDVNKLSIVKIRFLHNFIDQNKTKTVASNGSAGNPVA